MNAADGTRRDLIDSLPLVFVLIWSTGFVVARLAMPHAPPLTFLCWRYALSIIAFALWSWMAGAPWPRGRRAWWHLAITGLFMHAGYLGGVWVAVKAGASAGTVALIVGLQPLFTAVWVSWSGTHHVSKQQWFGLGLGLLGLALVVAHKLGLGGVTPFNLGMSVAALFCITVGTLYQKRHVAPCDVRTANGIQIGAALLVTLPLAAMESGTMQWGPELGIALAWSVLALTLGGSSLLMLLIQRGAATKVTSLFYLVPPCTAVMAWWMFDEALSMVTAMGMLLCALGVALVLKGEGRAKLAQG